jgi:tRNA(Ile)-lysidine synthase
VLVALSGGQDSLCLVALLRDLQPKWQWTLAIAHCNHQWRTDASANAAHLRALAQSWHLPYYETSATALEKREAAARTWRYHALADMATQAGCGYVATGHTSSDRAETLLYNLLRGSGSDGLQALTWQRPLTPTVQLVRPLLTCTRAQTAQFCQTAHLPIWEDPTNHDLTYARNRIRQELIPYLQTHFNPSVETTLTQTAELLRADVAYLEAQAATLLTQVRHPTQVGLHRTQLQQAPLALQRRAIRQFLQATLPTAPNFDHIEKIQQLVAAPNRSQTDPFPGGAIAQAQGDWIVLTPPPTQP